MWEFGIGIAGGLIANFLFYIVLRLIVPNPDGSSVHNFHSCEAAIAALLSIVVVAYVGGMLYLTGRVWVLAPEWNIAAVAGTFCGIVLLSFLLRTSGRSILEELIIVSIVPGILIVVIHLSVPKYVDFMCPPAVGDFEIIKGRTPSNHWNIYVLVHPERTEDWWVQQVPVVDQFGNWQSHARFAGGVGDIFEIVAVASEGAASLQEGQTIKPVEVRALGHLSRICVPTKGQ